MSVEQALLDSVWEEPHDDARRLIYADYLEEHGRSASDRDRAELIRVQCELERLEGNYPRYDILQARADEILRRWGKTWWGQMPKGCKKGTFRRGFPVVSLARFSPEGLVRLGEERLRAAPTWRYHYGVSGAHLDTLLAWPFLHRLEMFALRPPLPAGWAQRFADCANLRNVIELALIDCRVSGPELKLLLDTWAGRPLSEVRLKFDEESLGCLVNHPTAAGLRTLAIISFRPTSAGVAILKGGRHLRLLTRLVIDHEPFGDAGVSGLLGWPPLPRLRDLFLSYCRLTDAAAEELAACPAVANLRRLHLNGNQITEAGALALAHSPHLDRLEYLSVYGNPLRESPAAVAALRKRFGKKNVWVS